MNLSRRTFVELSSAAAMSKVIAARAEQPRPPNIILMLGDDHRGDALGCMGNQIVQTPHLDRLAHDGVLFENHFATTPICCASRASITTGQYAGTTGIYDFFTPYSHDQVQRAYWMRLKEAGYRIGFIGKFGVGTPAPAGWADTRKNVVPDDKKPSDYFEYWKAFLDQGHYFPEGLAGPHLTQIMRDQAIEFLQNTSDPRPFCLSLSFKAPHVQDEDPRQYLPSRDTLSLYESITIPPPRGAATSHIDRFPLAIQRSENRRRWGVRFATPALYQASMKGYYRLVSGIDSAVASIRDTLSKQGLADNTIIIYSADHGIFNGEHGLAGKWYGHEESIRIPLIIYDPRLPANSAGGRRRAMTLNIDLQPTVLDLAGLKPPRAHRARAC